MKQKSETKGPAAYVMPGLHDSITLHTGPSETKPGSTSSGTPHRHILIYLITGNPGLIDYYRPFLLHLQSLLQPLAATSGSGGVTFTIAGNSLAGFHASRYKSTAFDGDTLLPLNLQQQIGDVEERLLAAAAEVLGDREDPVEVILIGHSVGSYILMSLLQRWNSPPRSSYSTTRISSRITPLAGLCLFPTIVDLHASPSGRKVSWIAHLPGFALVLQGLAKLLCWALPPEWLLGLVKRVTGQGAQAAGVTAGFLGSPMGVWQAVYLAQWELRKMREDRWSEEVWGAETGARASTRGGVVVNDLHSGVDWKTKLFFYWAENDHWIANSTRDAVIARRAGGDGKAGPRMEIDMHGTPHDFCVRGEDSVRVAEKVAGCVREVVVGR